MKNKATILKNVSQRSTGENLNKELLKIAKANGGGEKDVPELRNFYYRNIVENEEKRNAYFAQKPKARDKFSFVNFKKQTPPEEPKIEKSKTKEAQKFEEDKRKRRESFFKKKEKVKREVLAEAKKKGVNITPKTKTPKTPKAKKVETGEFKGTKKQIEGMIMEKLKEFTPAAEGTVDRDIVWESLYFNGVEKLGDVLNSPDYSKVKKVFSIDYPSGIDRSEIGKMEKDLRTFIYKKNADNDKAREKNASVSYPITGFFISGNAMFIINDIDNNIELAMLDNFIDTKGYSIRNF